MRVEVHERDGFKLVRTTEPVAAGAVVLRLSMLDIRDVSTRTSIRVGPNQHVEDPVGSYVNHSCTPTCEVDGLDIVALYDLPRGAEVTFDYSENEGPLASPFTCLECGQLLHGAPAPCRNLRPSS